jgi:hypothetical protein
MKCADEILALTGISEERREGAKNLKRVLLERLT